MLLHAILVPVLTTVLEQPKQLLLQQLGLDGTQELIGRCQAKQRESELRSVGLFRSTLSRFFVLFPVFLVMIHF